MKIIKSFIYSFILISLFSVSVISQTVNSKLALIDSEVFKDKLNGINEVIEAYERLEAELKPQTDELNAIAETARNLSKEINEIITVRKNAPKGVIFPPLDNEIEEFKNLNVEYKEKDNQKKLLYTKRKSEIFAELNKRILDSLKKFAEENNFGIVLDIGKLNEELMYACFPLDTRDITKEFIEFYNRNFSVNNQK